MLKNKIMTKEEVIKQLQWKRDNVCNIRSTDDKELKLICKVQRDAYDRCIKLIEQ